MARILNFDTIQIRLQLPNIATYFAAGITPPTGTSDSQLLVYLQEQITATTGETLRHDDFTVWYLQGTASISDADRYTVVVKTNNTNLYESALLNRNVVITIPYSEVGSSNRIVNQERRIAGVITNFTPFENATDEAANQRWYQLTVESRIARLKHSRDSRVATNNTVIEAAKDLLSHYGLAQRATTVTYANLLVDYFRFGTNTNIANSRYPFIVQYEEDDFSFIKRILAREGFFFYSEVASYATKFRAENGTVTDVNYYYDTLVISDLTGQDVALASSAVTDRRLSYTPDVSTNSVFSDNTSISVPISSSNQSIAGVQLMRPKQTAGGYLGDTFIQENVIDSAQDNRNLHFVRNTGKHVLRRESFFVDLNVNINTSHNSLQLRPQAVDALIASYNSNSAPIIRYESIDASLKLNTTLTYTDNLTGAAASITNNYVTSTIRITAANSGATAASLPVEISDALIINPAFSAVVSAHTILYYNGTRNISIPLRTEVATNPVVPDTFYGVVCSPRYDYDTKRLQDSRNRHIFKYTPPAVGGVTPDAIFVVETAAGSNRYVEVRYNLRERQYREVTPTNSVSITNPARQLTIATFGLVGALSHIDARTGFDVSYYDYALAVNTKNHSQSGSPEVNSNRYLVKINFNRHSYIIPVDAIQKSSPPMPFSQLNTKDSGNFYNPSIASSSFPLRVDTQVLVGFLNEDCDLPYIKKPIDDASPAAGYWLNNYNSLSGFVGSSYPLARVTSDNNPMPITDKGAGLYYFDTTADNDAAQQAVKRDQQVTGKVQSTATTNTTANRYYKERDVLEDITDGNALVDGQQANTAYRILEEQKALFADLSDINYQKDAWAVARDKYDLNMLLKLYRYQLSGVSPITNFTSFAVKNGPPYEEIDYGINALTMPDTSSEAGYQGGLYTGDATGSEHITLASRNARSAIQMGRSTWPLYTKDTLSELQVDNQQVYASIAGVSHVVYQVSVGGEQKTAVLLADYSLAEVTNSPTYVVQADGTPMNAATIITDFTPTLLTNSDNNVIVVSRNSLSLPVQNVSISGVVTKVAWDVTNNMFYEVSLVGNVYTLNTARQHPASSLSSIASQKVGTPPATIKVAQTNGTSVDYYIFSVNGTNYYWDLAKNQLIPVTQTSGYYLVSPRNTLTLTSNSARTARNYMLEQSIGPYYQSLHGGAQNITITQPVFAQIVAKRSSSTQSVINNRVMKVSSDEIERHLFSFPELNVANQRIAPYLPTSAAPMSELNGEFITTREVGHKQYYRDDTQHYNYMHPESKVVHFGSRYKSYLHPEIIKPLALSSSSNEKFKPNILYRTVAEALTAYKSAAGEKSAFAESSWEGGEGAMNVMSLLAIPGGIVAGTIPMSMRSQGHNIRVSDELLQLLSKAKTINNPKDPEADVSAHYALSPVTIADNLTVTPFGAALDKSNGSMTADNTEIEHHLLAGLSDRYVSYSVPSSTGTGSHNYDISKSVAVAVLAGLNRSTMQSAGITTRTTAKFLLESLAELRNFFTNNTDINLRLLDRKGNAVLDTNRGIVTITSTAAGGTVAATPLRGNFIRVRTSEDGEYRVYNADDEGTVSAQKAGKSYPVYNYDTKKRDLSTLEFIDRNNDVKAVYWSPDEQLYVQLTHDAQKDIYLESSPRVTYQGPARTASNDIVYAYAHGSTFNYCYWDASVGAYAVLLYDSETYQYRNAVVRNTTNQVYLVVINDATVFAVRNSDGQYQPVRETQTPTGGATYAIDTTNIANLTIDPLYNSGDVFTITTDVTDLLEGVTLYGGSFAAVLNGLILSTDKAAKETLQTLRNTVNNDEASLTKITKAMQSVPEAQAAKYILTFDDADEVKEFKKVTETVSSKIHEAAIKLACVRLLGRISNFQLTTKNDKVVLGFPYGKLALIAIDALADIKKQMDSEGVDTSAAQTVLNALASLLQNEGFAVSIDGVTPIDAITSATDVVAVNSYLNQNNVYAQLRTIATSAQYRTVQTTTVADAITKLDTTVTPVLARIDIEQLKTVIGGIRAEANTGIYTQYAEYSGRTKYFVCDGTYSCLWDTSINYRQHGTYISGLDGSQKKIVGTTQAVENATIAKSARAEKAIRWNNSGDLTFECNTFSLAKANNVYITSDIMTQIFGGMWITYMGPSRGNPGFPHSGDASVILMYQYGAFTRVGAMSDRSLICATSATTTRLAIAAAGNREAIILGVYKLITPAQKATHAASFEKSGLSFKNTLALSEQKFGIDQHNCFASHLPSVVETEMGALTNHLAPGVPAVNPAGIASMGGAATAAKTMTTVGSIVKVSRAVAMMDTAADASKLGDMSKTAGTAGDAMRAASDLNVGGGLRVSVSAPNLGTYTVQPPMILGDRINLLHRDSGLQGELPESHVTSSRSVDDLSQIDYREVYSESGVSSGVEGANMSRSAKYHLEQPHSSMEGEIRYREHHYNINSNNSVRVNGTPPPEGVENVAGIFDQVVVGDPDNVVRGEAGGRVGLEDADGETVLSDDLSDSTFDVPPPPPDREASRRHHRTSSHYDDVPESTVDSDDVYLHEVGADNPMLSPMPAITKQDEAEFAKGRIPKRHIEAAYDSMRFNVSTGISDVGRNSQQNERIISPLEDVSTTTKNKANFKKNQDDFKTADDVNVKLEEGIGRRIRNRFRSKSAEKVTIVDTTASAGAQKADFTATGSGYTAREILTAAVAQINLGKVRASSALETHQAAVDGHMKTLHSMVQNTFKEVNSFHSMENIHNTTDYLFAVRKAAAHQGSAVAPNSTFRLLQQAGVDPADLIVGMAKSSQNTLDRVFELKQATATVTQAQLSRTSTSARAAEAASTAYNKNHERLTDQSKAGWVGNALGKTIPTNQTRIDMPRRLANEHLQELDKTAVLKNEELFAVNESLKHGKAEFVDAAGDLQVTITQVKLNELQTKWIYTQKADTQNRLEALKRQIERIEDEAHKATANANENAAAAVDVDAAADAANAVDVNANAKSGERLDDLEAKRETLEKQLKQFDVQLEELRGQNDQLIEQLKRSDVDNKRSKVELELDRTVNQRIYMADGVSRRLEDDERQLQKLAEKMSDMFNRKPLSNAQATEEMAIKGRIEEAIRSGERQVAVGDQVAEAKALRDAGGTEKVRRAEAVYIDADRKIADLINKHKRATEKDVFADIDESVLYAADADVRMSVRQLTQERNNIANEANNMLSKMQDQIDAEIAFFERMSDMFSDKKARLALTLTSLKSRRKNLVAEFQKLDVTDSAVDDDLFATFRAHVENHVHHTRASSDAEIHLENQWTTEVQRDTAKHYTAKLTKTRRDFDKQLDDLQTRFKNAQEKLNSKQTEAFGQSLGNNRLLSPEALKKATRENLNTLAANLEEEYKAYVKRLAAIKRVEARAPAALTDSEALTQDFRKKVRTLYDNALQKKALKDEYLGGEAVVAGAVRETVGRVIDDTLATHQPDLDKRMQDLVNAKQNEEDRQSMLHQERVQQHYRETLGQSTFEDQDTPTIQWIDKELYDLKDQIADLDEAFKKAKEAREQIDNRLAIEQKKDSDLRKEKEAELCDLRGGSRLEDKERELAEAVANQHDLHKERQAALEKEEALAQQHTELLVHKQSLEEEYESLEYQQALRYAGDDNGRLLNTEAEINAKLAEMDDQLVTLREKIGQWAAKAEQAGGQLDGITFRRKPEVYKKAFIQHEEAMRAQSDLITEEFRLQKAQAALEKKRNALPGENATQRPGAGQGDAEVARRRTEALEHELQSVERATGEGNVTIRRLREDIKSVQGEIGEIERGPLRKPELTQKHGELNKLQDQLAQSVERRHDLASKRYRLELQLDDLENTDVEAAEITKRRDSSLADRREHLLKREIEAKEALLKRNIGQGGDSIDPDYAAARAANLREEIKDLEALEKNLDKHIENQANLVKRLEEGGANQEELQGAKRLLEEYTNSKKSTLEQKERAAQRRIELLGTPERGAYSETYTEHGARQPVRATPDKEFLSEEEVGYGGTQSYSKTYTEEGAERGVRTGQRRRLSLEQEKLIREARAQLSEHSDTCSIALQELKYFVGRLANSMRDGGAKHIEMSVSDVRGLADKFSDANKVPQKIREAIKNLDENAKQAYDILVDALNVTMRHNLDTLLKSSENIAAAKRKGIKTVDTGTSGTQSLDALAAKYADENIVPYLEGELVQLKELAAKFDAGEYEQVTSAALPNREAALDFSTGQDINKFEEPRMQTVRVTPARGQSPDPADTAGVTMRHTTPQQEASRQSRQRLSGTYTPEGKVTGVNPPPKIVKLGSDNAWLQSNAETLGKADADMESLLLGNQSMTAFIQGALDTYNRLHFDGSTQSAKNAIKLIEEKIGKTADELKRFDRQKKELEQEMKDIEALSNSPGGELFQSESMSKINAWQEKQTDLIQRMLATSGELKTHLDGLFQNELEMTFVMPQFLDKYRQDPTHAARLRDSSSPDISRQAPADQLATLKKSKRAKENHLASLNTQGIESLSPQGRLALHWQAFTKLGCALLRKGKEIEKLLDTRALVLDANNKAKKAFYEGALALLGKDTADVRHTGAGIKIDGKPTNKELYEFMTGQSDYNNEVLLTPFEASALIRKMPPSVKATTATDGGQIIPSNPSTMYQNALNRRNAQHTYTASSVYYPNVKEQQQTLALNFDFKRHMKEKLPPEETADRFYITMLKKGADKMDTLKKQGDSKHAWLQPAAYQLPHPSDFERGHAGMRVFPFENPDIKKTQGEIKDLDTQIAKRAEEVEAAKKQPPKQQLLDADPRNEAFMRRVYGGYVANARISLGTAFAMTEGLTGADKAYHAAAAGSLPNITTGGGTKGRVSLAAQAASGADDFNRLAVGMTPKMSAYLREEAIASLAHESVTSGDATLCLYDTLLTKHALKDNEFSDVKVGVDEVKPEAFIVTDKATVQKVLEGRSALVESAIRLMDKTTHADSLAVAALDRNAYNPHLVLQDDSTVTVDMASLTQEFQQNTPTNTSLRGFMQALEADNEKLKNIGDYRGEENSRRLFTDLGEGQVHVVADKRTPPTVLRNPDRMQSRRSMVKGYINEKETANAAKVRQSLFGGDLEEMPPTDGKARTLRVLSEETPEEMVTAVSYKGLPPKATNHVIVAKMQDEVLARTRVVDKKRGDLRRAIQEDYLDKFREYEGELGGIPRWMEVEYAHAKDFYDPRRFTMRANLEETPRKNEVPMRDKGGDGENAAFRLNKGHILESQEQTRRYIENTPIGEVRRIENKLYRHVVDNPAKQIEPGQPVIDKVHYAAWKHMEANSELYGMGYRVVGQSDVSLRNVVDIGARRLGVQTMKDDQFTTLNQYLERLPQKDRAASTATGDIVQLRGTQHKLADSNAELPDSRLATLYEGTTDLDNFDNAPIPPVYRTSDDPARQSQIRVVERQSAIMEPESEDGLLLHSDSEGSVSLIDMEYVDRVLEDIDEEIKLIRVKRNPQGGGPDGDGLDSMRLSEEEQQSARSQSSGRSSLSGTNQQPEEELASSVDTVINKYGDMRCFSTPTPDALRQDEVWRNIEVEVRQTEGEEIKRLDLVGNQSALRVFLEQDKDGHTNAFVHAMVARVQIGDGNDYIVSIKHHSDKNLFTLTVKQDDNIDIDMQQRLNKLDDGEIDADNHLFLKTDITEGHLRGVELRKLVDLVDKDALEGAGRNQQKGLDTVDAGPSVDDILNSAMVSYLGDIEALVRAAGVAALVRRWAKARYMSKARRELPDVLIPTLNALNEFDVDKFEDEYLVSTKNIKVVTPTEVSTPIRKAPKQPTPAAGAAGMVGSDAIPVSSGGGSISGGSGSGDGSGSGSGGSGGSSNDDVGIAAAATAATAATGNMQDGLALDIAAADDEDQEEERGQWHNDMAESEATEERGEWHNELAESDMGDEVADVADDEAKKKVAQATNQDADGQNPADTALDNGREQNQVDTNSANSEMDFVAQASVVDQQGLNVGTIASNLSRTVGSKAIFKGAKALQQSMQSKNTQKSPNAQQAKPNEQSHNGKQAAAQQQTTQEPKDAVSTANGATNNNAVADNNKAVQQVANGATNGANANGATPNKPPASSGNGQVAHQHTANNGTNGVADVDATQPAKQVQESKKSSFMLEEPQPTVSHDIQEDDWFST